MATLGKINGFHANTGNIQRYLERLEQYFEANGVAQDSEASMKLLTAEYSFEDTVKIEKTSWQIKVVIIPRAKVVVI